MSVAHLYLALPFSFCTCSIDHIPSILLSCKEEEASFPLFFFFMCLCDGDGLASLFLFFFVCMPLLSAACAVSRVSSLFLGCMTYAFFFVVVVDLYLSFLRVYDICPFM